MFHNDDARGGAALCCQGLLFVVGVGRRTLIDLCKINRDYYSILFLKKQRPRYATHKTPMLFWLASPLDAGYILGGSEDLKSRKKSTSPPHLWGVNYIIPQLWNGLYHPLNFSKPVKLSPKAVLKNHSKSQKNHKMENPIVLDSKWVDLHSEYIIWYALVYFLQL